MIRPKSPKIVSLPVHGGKWSATMQTPGGPVTAVGDSIGEAEAELGRLLVMARAVELTRHNESC